MDYQKILDTFITALERFDREHGTNYAYYLYEMTPNFSSSISELLREAIESEHQAEPSSSPASSPEER